MSPIVRRGVLAALAAGVCLTGAVTPGHAASTPRSLYDDWAASLSQTRCDGNLTASRYSKDAVLLATFKSKIVGRKKIRGYFDHLTCNENLRVATNWFRAGGNHGIKWATGLYTFKYDSDTGGPVEVPARFTFVWHRNSQGEWRIVNHQSSQRPKSEG